MLKKREHEKLKSEINVVPLTDVMLVLLIIFMVTTPFIIQGNIKINLPSAKAPSDIVDQKNIIIGIAKEGKIFLNGKEVISDEFLEKEIRKIIAETGNARVIIEGDKMAYHGAIVKVMGIARLAGAEKLAITTIPQAGNEGF